MISSDRRRGSHIDASCVRHMLMLPVWTLDKLMRKWPGADGRGRYRQTRSRIGRVGRSLSARATRTFTQTLRARTVARQTNWIGGVSYDVSPEGGK